MSVEPSRTHHATQAVQLGELVAIRFSEQKYGTDHPRVLKVNNPDGPSTDGGLKARQSIVLVHVGAETSAGALVLGWLDATRRNAELRPYASVNQAQQARFGHGVDISKAEYDRCVNDLHEFFRTQGIDSRVQVAQPAGRRSLPPGQAPSAGGNDVGAFVGVGLAALGMGFGLCYALFVAGVLKV